MKPKKEDKTTYQLKIWKKPHADYQPNSGNPQTTTSTFLTEQKREKGITKTTTKRTRLTRHITTQRLRGAVFGFY